MAGIALNELFSGGSDTDSVKNVRERLLGKVRASMGRVFEDLVLVSLGDPTNNGTFIFKKGMIEEYRYGNLSAGEKAAFDLLLDFILKTEFLTDTIFCLDEPETHMHSALQGKLLKELFFILPEKSQLWIATHSVGMVREAFRLYGENSENVAFLDFGEHDYDESVVIYPANVNRTLWKKLFAVVLEDLANMLTPSKIYICEGSKRGSGGKNVEFDATIYRIIFNEGYPDMSFISGGGTLEIENYISVLTNAFDQLFQGVEIWRIYDRDDRSSGEIDQVESSMGVVLRKRDLENYLWDDEIIGKLCIENGKSELLQQIIEQKLQLMRESVERGNPSDDVKSIGGPLYVFVKKALNIVGQGNTKEEFCKSVLAPLVTPETTIYKDLRSTIFRTK